MPMPFYVRERRVLPREPQIAQTDRVPATEPTPGYSLCAEMPATQPTTGAPTGVPSYSVDIEPAE